MIKSIILDYNVSNLEFPTFIFEKLIVCGSISSFIYLAFILILVESILMLSKWRRKWCLIINEMCSGVSRVLPVCLVLNSLQLQLYIFKTDKLLYIE